MDAYGEWDDAALVRATGVGDRAAFEVLVGRHRPLVARIAARYGLSIADADDLAQEAFVRVWQAAPTWRLDGAMFSTWFYRVVSNLCVDHLRRSKVRRASDLDAAMEVVDEQAERRLRAAEDAALLRSVMAGLPERQRLAVELVHLEGRSAAETGLVLGVSEGAVEGLLARARRAIRIDMRRLGLSRADF
ncbi:MAG: sigma-70 family RNA polymerase sigma factor [Rhodospirillales bacterium]